MDIERIIRVLNNHGMRVVCKENGHYVVDVYTQHGQTFEELVKITEHFQLKTFLGY